MAYPHAWIQALLRRWQALDGTQRSLLALILARWALALAFILNLLPLELRDPVYRWYLQHGGDQEQMMSLARSILVGSPEESVVGLGQALVMLPWIALLHPTHYIEMVAPLVIINGFLLAGLSVLWVGGIARALTNSRTVTLGAATAWAFLPLAAYFGFFWHSEAVTLRSAMVPKVGWLNGLSDGPATFFLLLAVFLLARGRGTALEHNFGRLVGAGAALGAAVTFRVHTAPMVAFLMVYVLAAHGWRGLLAMGGGTALGYLPQAWYNLAVFGLPFTTGYISYGDLLNWGGTLQRPLRDILTNLPFHPRYLAETLVYFLGRRPWLLLPLGGGLAMLALATFALWREGGWQAAALLIGAPLAYLAPLALAFNFREDPVRFLMPCLALWSVAGVYALCWLVAWMKLRLARPHIEQGG